MKVVISSYIIGFLLWFGFLWFDSLLQLPFALLILIGFIFAISFAVRVTPVPIPCLKSVEVLEVLAELDDAELFNLRQEILQKRVIRFSHVCPLWLGTRLYLNPSFLLYQSDSALFWIFLFKTVS